MVYTARRKMWTARGWVYVQTAADGTDNHVVFTVDLHETRTVYASGIGTIVNGWAEKMENLTLSASENGTDYTPLAAFDNAELAAEWGHRHEWACPEGAPVTARYLRYEFDIATSQITDGAVHYVCVDADRRAHRSRYARASARGGPGPGRLRKPCRRTPVYQRVGSLRQLRG